MRRRRRSDRGSVLVEMAMIVPFLMGLMLAVFELGMMLRSDIVISNAVRTGARVASQAGKSINPSSDYTTLKALGTALAGVDRATINYVVIYEVPTGTNTAAPAACTPASPSSSFIGVVGVCNYYSGADLTAVLGTASQSSLFGCLPKATDWDGPWCPSDRVTDQTAAGPDYLGVQVSLTVPTYTKLFGSSHTFKDHYVMRLEPTGAGSST